jgi:ABC-type transporter MlaC component
MGITKMTETIQERNARLISDTAVATAERVFEAAKAAALLIADEHKNKDNETSTKIARLEEKLSNLKDQQDKFEIDLTGKINAIFAKIDKIVDRPSWSVVTIISILSIICTGLIVKQLG